MTPRPLRLRLAAHALFLANGLMFGIWAATLPRLKEAQALSDAGLGAMLLLVSFGAVAAMPATALMSARIGASRVAALAGLGMAVALGLPAAAPGGLGLLASATLLGVTGGTMDVAMNAHASDVERLWGRPIMSSFHAGWSVGGLLGSALAGLMAARGVGLWPSYAWPGLLIAMLAIPALGMPALGTRKGGARLALPGRAVLAVAVLAGLCFAVEGAVADWTGVYLRDDLHADAAVSASAFGAFSLAMAGGRLLGDALVRRAGGAVVAVAGGLLAAAGQAAVLAASGPLQIDAALVLIGLGLANIVPIVFSAAGRLRGAEGVAMAATTGYAGLLAAPPLLGGVAQHFGLHAALAVVLAGIVLLAALSAACRGLRPQSA